MNYSRYYSVCPYSWYDIINTYTNLPQNMARKRLVLVAGHSGPGMDPGAVANGFTEHDIAKNIVLLVKDIVGVHVDVEIILSGNTLSKKIELVNKKKPDFSIELHLDAGPTSATGATIFYLTGQEGQRTRADKILNTYCEKTNLKKRSTRGDTTSNHGRLGFVRDIKNESYLIELGFITNKEDIRIIQKHAAYALSVGLLEFFNIPMNNIFNDVPDSHPYANFIKWAKENGIAKGFADGSFKPDEPITAGRLMAFLKNFDTYLKK